MQVAKITTQMESSKFNDMQLHCSYECMQRQRGWCTRLTSAYQCKIPCQHRIITYRCIHGMSTGVRSLSLPPPNGYFLPLSLCPWAGWREKLSSDFSWNFVGLWLTIMKEKNPFDILGFILLKAEWQPFWIWWMCHRTKMIYTYVNISNSIRKIRVLDLLTEGVWARLRYAPHFVISRT